MGQQAHYLPLELQGATAADLEVQLRLDSPNFQLLNQEIKKLESSTHHRFNEIGKVLDAMLKQKQQQENQHNRRRIGFKQGDR